MVDYSYALRNTLLYKYVFKKSPIIIHCFFHFIQAIVKKLKELKIIQKKITKKSFELIKNIELICFIPPKYIDDYIKFLKSKLNDDKEKHLFEYLYKTWFSKNGRSSC